MPQPPTIFIGSSAEGLPYAEAIAAELASFARSTVWTQDVFRPMKGTLEQLEEIKHNFEYAILVMTPDDTTRIRKQTLKTTRDNVVFELGLFIGALGRWHVFFVKSKEGKNERIPSDLLGITPLYYLPPTKSNLGASVRASCRIIKKEIQANTHRGRTTLLDGSASDVRFWHTIADRAAHHKEARSLIAASTQHVVVTGITLNYLVRYCAEELRDALARGVNVGLVIANKTDRLLDYYAHYTRTVRQSLPSAHKLYAEFYDSLDAQQRTFFSLYHTNVPLTHSIGLYDGHQYVSMFCIDHASSVSPSFSPLPGSHSYMLIIKELKHLLVIKDCVRGRGHRGLTKVIGIN